MTDAAMMELSCTEAPLYGQTIIYGKFDNILPEEAEFYFVYKGSIQKHVVYAKQINENTLESIIPAHREPEDVSVFVVMYGKESEFVILGSSFLTFKRDIACELACFLVSQTKCLTPSSHHTLLSQFDLVERDLQSMDHEVMLATACEEIPSSWNIVGNSAEDESKCKETLLHLSMRLGLVQLSQFLLFQPGGTVAVTLLNEEGLTPLDLALQNGHFSLVEMFSKSQTIHPFEISKVEVDEKAVLQFAHSSGTLLLTSNHTTDLSLESDVQLYRKFFWDRTFTQKNITPKEAETLRGMQMPCNSITSKEDLIDVASEESPLKNEDFTFHQEHIIHPQENEDENVLDLAQQYSPFEAYRRRPNPSTFFAAAKLSALLNGNDEVYANRMVVDQLEDAGVKYINNSQSTSETNTDSSKDPEVLENISSNKNLSSFMIPSLDTSGSYMPLKKTHYFSNIRNHRYPFIKKRSSSLDDLDVDNGDERSHNCYSSVSYNSSVILPSDRERLNSSEPTARLDGSMNRAESLPLSSSLQSKESLLSGVRSRSYSYTSPKVLLGKPQCAQEFIQCDSNDELHAFSLQEQSEKGIQEEEWDKYIIPTKSESEKYKVSRTFSFLMNRMASTRNKSKAKNKDAKEKEKANRHHFVSGSYAGVMPCFTCEKPLLGKESLQCSYCNAIVHKSCKDCAPVCTKKLQDRSYVKNKIQTVQTNLSFRDTPQPAFLATLPSTTIPIGVSLMKKEALQQQQSLSRSVPSTTSERKSMSSLEPDTTSWRPRSHSEELLQTLGSSSSVDSFIIEDDVDASLWNDLSSDTQEFEAESWSLVVEPWFCNQQEKDVIKRQDVIFELMQTEVHHIHTLFIMSKIFRKGMKEELQLDHSTVDKIFPCLDELLELHQQFFCRMKERRQHSSQEGSDRNFVICKIGDVLVQQFSEENARKMKAIYGEFCSHQKEAVSLFKELQQNKKFQNFIKLRNSNLLARRRGIPECILLVTQRITKYPVLLGRILQYTKEGTEEHQDLCRALNLIKDMIAAVDLQVSEYEKKEKLLEILSKVENKTYTKLKNGHVFRKQDLIKKQRTLLHEGLVYWKTATGRFKDILALLLNDVMLFLQEKDQKYIFAAVDQKPAVIALQKLIVREVANEERGMFLISASSTGPEMYEIHTSSKEERSHWMRQIQEAVESCPEEEGKIGDSDEDRKLTEARAAKIQKCQVLLNNQDQQICNYLEEKLNIYAKLGNMSGFEEVHAEPHLLIKPDSGETPQVASLLAAALKEAENLHTTVALLKTKDTNHSEEENVGDSCLTNLSETELCEPFTDCTELKVEKETCYSDMHNENNVAEMDILDQEENACFSASPQTEVVQTIQNLTRLLYSIQAALTIQDTHIEINKLLLQEHERSGLSHSPRSTFFPEQEKHRNLKEEFANIHKLQQQFQQEQQRWHRECEQQQQALETRESRLLEKQKECCSQEELLCRNREELDGQFQDYQQNLERLQESQRMVEKERETVRLQQNILQRWKHNHQSNLPAVISSENNEIMGPLHLDSFCGENSAIIKETLVQMSLNHLNRSNSLAYQDCESSVNLTDPELPRRTENQANFNVDISCQQTSTPDLSKWIGPPHHPSSSTNQSDACNNHMNALQSQYPSLQDFDSTHGNFQLLHPSDVLLHNLPCDMEQDSENGGMEENIVYL